MSFITYQSFDNTIYIEKTISCNINSILKYKRCQERRRVPIKSYRCEHGLVLSEGPYGPQERDEGCDTSCDEK